MDNFKPILEKLAQRQDLTPQEARSALGGIISGDVGVERTSAFLLGMRSKGETIEELTTFVEVMRDAAERPEVDVDGAVDLCGTGGDNLGTFNISTAAMFVVAGAGVPVLKHGNRSVSSKSGSADVLEALDIVATLHKEQIERVFEEIQVSFMIAPNFHPTMKHVMPARQILGIRSFFNTMGPLLNPAGVRRQVVGAFDNRTARQIAQILSNLDSERVYSVHSRDGLDEFSLTAPTFIHEIKNNEYVGEKEFNASSLGFSPVSLQDLQGGDRFYNAKIIRSVLEGEGEQAHRDIVLLNATFGIHVSGRADSLEQAKQMALESIDSGAALKTMKRMSEATNDIMESN
ncbi:MAG TPA: anthranilate phosphoribosyltransferase [Balneolaceae bacterium]|nr:anthranilate phosphoribosyltransferase [Balneolaceae bacterium]